MDREETMKKFDLQMFADSDRIYSFLKNCKNGRNNLTEEELQKMDKQEIINGLLDYVEAMKHEH